MVAASEQTFLFSLSTEQNCMMIGPDTMNPTFCTRATGYFHHHDPSVELVAFSSCGQIGRHHETLYCKNCCFSTCCLHASSARREAVVGIVRLRAVSLARFPAGPSCSHVAADGLLFIILVLVPYRGQGGIWIFRHWPLTSCPKTLQTNPQSSSQRQ